MGLPIDTCPATPPYSVTHEGAVWQIFDELKDPQASDLLTYAEMNVSWGRYAFLTPEETASLALCGFDAEYVCE